MRKSGIVLLVLVVVAACVLAAGCIGTNNSTATPTQTPVPTGNGTVAPTPAPTEEPVKTVTVQKFGMAIPANDMIRFGLPANPTTGYQWAAANVTGLVINQTYDATPVAEGIVGSGGHDIFTITAENAGTYTFTAGDQRSWENETPLETFTQQLVFANVTDRPADEPMLSVTFDGTVNPKTGEVVKIVTEGNPTTGYQWIVSNDTTVKVLNSTFVASAADSGPIVGVGGNYEWLVTADKAGTYVFGAEYKRSWEEEPVGAFFFKITFV